MASTDSSQTRGGRRSQDQRRAETRGKLLDATIQSLLEVGYVATTTRRVADLAGVSQGAQTHHFPRRVDLMAAAVERLAAQRIAELRELATRFPAATDERLEAIIDLLWADFSSSTFTVFVKLWVAAADDSELYARLVAVEHQLVGAISQLTRELSGELAQRPHWERRVQLALAAVRGLALTEQFEPRGRSHRDLWPAIRPALLDVLSA
jgi:AcrR family transcriptional regulator